MGVAKANVINLISRVRQYTMALHESICRNGDQPLVGDSSKLEKGFEGETTAVQHCRHDGVCRAARAVKKALAAVPAVIIVEQQRGFVTIAQ